MKLRETVVVSGGLLTQQATVFATGILIARVLGAGDFGILGTLKSLGAILLIVTPLGLDLALLKHASFYHERLGELRTISRALRLLVAGLNVALLALVWLWVGGALQQIYQDIPNFSRLCVVTMLGLVFATDVQISGALYRVHDRVVPYALVVNYGQPVLRLAATCFVLAAGGDVGAVVWVNTAVFACTFITIASNDRCQQAAAKPMAVGEIVRSIRQVLSESLWMGMSLLVYQAIRLIDILVLAALTTPQITGEYTAMSSVAQLIQIYPIAISQTLGPRIAFAYKQGDLAGIKAELQAYLRKATVLGGFLFGGVAVFGADLDLVFGHGFTFPWLLPFLLAAGWYVSATLAPFGYVLSMTGRHRQELAILTGGAVLLIACLQLLIPPFAAIGAALAVAIVFVVVNAVRCGYVISILRLNPLRFQDVFPPACFLAAAFAVREAGTLLGTRSLAVLVAECIAYACLAGVAYVVFLSEPAERRMLRGLARSGRAS